MPVADITVKFVKSLPPLPDGKDKLRYFDNRLTGFVVEQRLSCVTFYFRYNDDRGRARDVKLGRFGDVTVEAARKRAEQLRADVSLGGAPPPGWTTTCASTTCGTASPRCWPTPGRR